MSKFSVERDPAVEEIFYVHWEPPPGGLTEGAAVRFEYSLSGKPGKQALEVRYPFKVTKRRKATFVIPREVTETSGSVVDYRVIIHRGGEVLAEYRPSS